MINFYKILPAWSQEYTKELPTSLAGWSLLTKPYSVIYISDQVVNRPFLNRVLSCLRITYLQGLIGTKWLEEEQKLLFWVNRWATWLQSEASRSLKHMLSNAWPLHPNTQRIFSDLEKRISIVEQPPLRIKNNSLFGNLLFVRFFFN